MPRHEPKFDLYADPDAMPETGDIPFLDRIAEGFRTFANEHYQPLSPANPRTVFQDLVENGQRPVAFVHRCCDARSATSMLMAGFQPGSLFVNATIGALVPPESRVVRAARRISPRFGDVAARHYPFSKAPHTWAALQYAIHGLKVPNVVILGHTGCGGLRALVDGNATGHIAGWVDIARPVLSVAKKLYAPANNREATYAAVEKANVVWGVRNVQSYLSTVFKDSSQRPPVHGLLFSMREGKLLLLKDVEKGTFTDLTPPDTLHLRHTHPHPAPCAERLVAAPK